MAVRSRTFTSKSDVYSFGVVVWEIFAGGATPYGDLQVQEVSAAVLSGSRRLPRPSPVTPDGVVQLIRRCTELNVGQRPSMAAVCEWLRQACEQPELRRLGLVEVGEAGVQAEGEGEEEAESEL
jgi:ephrin-A